MTITMNDELLGYAEQLGFGDVHFKLDLATGLQAIIAVHNTARGPALGGCRFIEYLSINDAIVDALRLARGMSYKAAMANLPLGGGKAVLVKPKELSNRKAYFAAFGRFVDELGGRYITAMDSGTQVADMDAIAASTAFVANTSQQQGNPSPSTALGVLRGIEAACKFKFGRSDLQGLHVAIQGIGNVGFNLAKFLYQKGAKLTVCDHDSNAAQRCANELGATVVGLEEIYAVKCDVFSPCALGAILNDQTIPQLKAKIIAGGANNQLAEQRHADVLLTHDILYAPDYVINSGGLIYAYGKYQQLPESETEQQLLAIYDTAMAIFERAQRTGKSTNIVADEIAVERLN